jgi:hypothetical protein
MTKVDTRNEPSDGMLVRRGVGERIGRFRDGGISPMNGTPHPSDGEYIYNIHRSKIDNRWKIKTKTKFAEDRHGNALIT